MGTFTERLIKKIRDCQNPVCVGLDPRWAQLPAAMTDGINPKDPSAAAEAYQRFCCEVIDVVATMVPVVKPQMAFFEQLGSAGLTVLQEVVQYARLQGLLVVLDGKRGDIGSTATAYADAYLGSDASSGMGTDALTVNPYLGPDTLEPFTKTAIERDAGLFVLVKTSNPGSGALQDLQVDGQPIYGHVAQWLNDANREAQPDGAYGPLGAVTGATHPAQLAEIREMCRQSFLLVPGYGAQGGGAADVAEAFDSDGLGAIINSSRGIIFAHNTSEAKELYGDDRWQDAVAAATAKMTHELQSETRVGKLMK